MSLSPGTTLDFASADGSSFGCKTVNLGSSAISRFVAITKYGYFVDLLQDLTLTGTEKVRLQIDDPAMPPQLEMIVCLLKREDICNLLLGSRTLDFASAQAHYKSIIGCETMELGFANSRFAAITKHSRFAGLLNFTLTRTEKGQATDCL